MPIVFAEISLKSGGGARTEGQFPPFRVRRSLTLHRCLCSRASYPLPRPSSVPSSREAHSVSGAVSVGSVHHFGTRSAERPRAQNAQERRTPKRTRTQNQNRISIFARMHGPVTLIPQQSRGYDTHFIGNRSVTRVFAGGSSISVWQGVNRGAVTPFRSERRFTPRLCLSSRTSYPLPRVSSDFAGGSRSFPVQVSVEAVHPFSTPSAESPLRFKHRLRRLSRSGGRARIGGQLPPPARVVSTDLEGNGASFRRRFSGAGTRLSLIHI